MTTASTDDTVAQYAAWHWLKMSVRIDEMMERAAKLSTEDSDYARKWANIYMRLSLATLDSAREIIEVASKPVSDG